MKLKDLLDKALSLFGLGSIVNTPESALALPTAYSCIKIISETIGMLPIHLYEKSKDGDRLEINNEISYAVSVRPNELMSASDFYGALMANVLAYGNGYAHINRSGNQISLMILPSKYVEVKENLEHTDIYYSYSTEKKKATYQRSEIIHIKGLGFDGIEGKSPIDYAAEAYGFALSTQKYGHEFFKNGAHIKGFIEMPDDVEIEGETAEEQEGTLKKIGRKLLSGLTGEDSAGKIGFLPKGGKFQAVTIPNDSAQFLESRRFSREEIAGMFRVPAYMIGEMGNAIKSNVENLSIGLIQYTIAPWLIKIEQELRYKLQPGLQQRYFKFNVNAILRGTALDRAQYLKEMRYAGLITEEEGRSYEDLPKNPKEGTTWLPKNTWGKEEYELELLKRRKELNATANN